MISEDESSSAQNQTAENIQDRSLPVGCVVQTSPEPECMEK